MVIFKLTVPVRQIRDLGHAPFRNIPQACGKPKPKVTL